MFSVVSEFLPFFGFFGHSAQAETAAELIKQVQSRSGTNSEMLANIERAFELLDAQNKVDPALWADAYQAKATILRMHGKLDEAVEAVSSGLEFADPLNYPTRYLRFKTMQAILPYYAGDPKLAEQKMTMVLAQDHSRADQVMLDRIRANYATIIQENGRMVDAIEIYQEVLERSLARGDEATKSLMLASNLVELLVTQGLFEDARDWLNRVRDLQAETDVVPLINALRVHEMLLQRMFGDPEGSAEQLRLFIENTPDAYPPNLGDAYQFLSESLLDLGELAAAERAARSAVETLESFPSEQLEAKIALAEVLLEEGKLTDYRPSAPAGSPQMAHSFSAD